MLWIISAQSFSEQQPAAKRSLCGFQSAKAPLDDLSAAEGTLETSVIPLMLVLLLLLRVRHLASTPCIRMIAAVASTPAAAVVGARLASILGAGRCIRRRVAGRLLLLLLSPSTTTTAAAAAGESRAPLAATAAAALHAGWSRHVVIHAVPRVLVREVLLLHARHLLPLVLLSLEHHLLLRAKAASTAVAASAAPLRIASLATIHGRVGIAAHATRVTLHGCHLIHLLHHGRVHVAALLGHHLLHHGVLHAVHHVHVAPHVVGRGHHAEVLLHTLPVGGHHCRCHGIAIRLISCRCGLIIAVEVSTAGTKLLSRAPAGTSAESSVVGVLLFAHLSTRLGALDLNRLVQDCERTLECALDGSLAVESDKTKPTRSSSLLVHHECSIQHATKLIEEVLKICFSGFLADTADKDLGRAFLFIPRDGSFGVDLDIMVSTGPLKVKEWVSNSTYQFSVKRMLLHHHRVDHFWISKCEKAEAS